MTTEQVVGVGTKGNAVLIGILMIAVIAIFLFLSVFAFVPAGSRGVLLEWGAVVGEPKSEGIHMVMPIMQRMVIMDCQTQKYSTEAASASSDLQTVHTTIAVNYHLDFASAGRMYKEVGADYANRLVVPAVQEATKASTAKFTAVELISRRDDMKTIIHDGLVTRLQPYGINIETVSIENFAFSDSFEQAIEAKVTAEQQALTAERKLEQVKFEAEQKIATANGEAEAKLKIATAEAQAIKIQGDALREAPNVVSLRAIEKWNGQLPTMMLGNAVPMLQLPTNTSSL